MIEKITMEQPTKELKPASLYQSGQALVEYALLIVMIVLSFGLALAATGPLVGNIFDNTITNLIGSNSEFVGQLPDAEGFWLTVTWVATQTPEEVPLPTRTLPPPSASPTFGPSPTPTPITPTNTPTPTLTPPPSPTPEDIIHPFGFSDTGDTELHWRIDNTFYTGSGRWHTIYYPRRDLEPTGDEVRFVYDALRFDWGGAAPVDTIPAGTYLAGDTYPDSFGAVFRRQFTFTQKTTLNINIPIINNGIRIWILGGAYGGNPDILNGTPGTCADAYASTSGRRAGGLGDSANRNWTRNVTVFDNQAFGYNPATSPDGDIPTACLLLDRWKWGDESSYSGLQRTIPAGTYTIMVEFFKRGGTSRINVEFDDLNRLVNPDDRRVDNSGNVVGTNTVCSWGPEYHPETPNSLDNMLAEFRGSQFQQNNRCYLELRGAVEIPADASNPVLTFWDIWDLYDGSSTWVEVADYDPNNDGVFDRSALTWNRINLHTNNSYNYNWTQQQIDLSAYAGRTVTFRFGMENRQSSSANRWKIDTIHVTNKVYEDRFMNQRWDLNNPAQKDEFITSGHWTLTGENVIGGVGLSFHESPGYDTARITTVRNNNQSSYLDGNMRMHTIEFKGFIDLMHVDGLVDSDGDAGDPILTFFHMYHLERRTGLEIQYTTDPYGTAEPNWQIVPGGELVPRNQTATNNNRVDLYEEVTVNLANIGESRFRLRFALVVHPNTGRRGGWWIDEIRLQRDGIQRYNRYPFIDNVEDPLSMDKWLRLGTWTRVEGGRRPAAGTTGYAYHDSPNGDYAPSSNNAFTLLDPFDMFLNTPENPRSPTCNLGDDCLTPDAAPINPVMTFWHKRFIDRDGYFYVEWKRLSENNDQWRPLWAYEERMTTNGTGYSDLTRFNGAWERVEIDLAPMMNQLNPADPYDDDVMFRFRLRNASTSRQADGVYVDDIRIENRQERVFYLWQQGQTRNSVVDGTILRTRDNSQPALGSGLELYDGLDNNANLFNGDWEFGGDWGVISWEQKNGLFAFHDTPVGQTQAPPDNTTPLTNTEHQTYSVLEMMTIIDLRGVDISERPMLSFWERYEVGQNDRISVEIAYQDLNNIGNANCRSSLPQCYEKLYGWSEWERVYEQYSNKRNYLWNLIQIPLDTYAAQAGRDGYRIRIRFVMNALDNASNLWDGWYIDEIRVKHFEHRLTRTPINNSQAGATFFDSARNMRNWIAEGKWGLDPEFFRGSGGGPASLGASVWSYQYFNLRASNNRCPSAFTNTQDALQCATAIFNNGEYATLTAPAKIQEGIVLEINNDFGLGGVAGITNYFAGRWTLTTGEVGVAVPAGTYTFIATVDDGMRMKYDTYPTPGGLPVPVEPDDPQQTGWNILNMWTTGGRRTDMGIAKLAAGNRYQFTVEWFENTSSAVMILSTGSNRFSFTDSPKQGSGLAFPTVPAQIRSSSALMYAGVFDFTLAQNPILQYYTYHQLGGTARVEVSPDGGFTWTQSGLAGHEIRELWNGGWRAEFYHGNANGGANNVLNAGGASPVVVQNYGADVDLNFNWGNGRPHPSVNQDHFSSRWTRQLVVTQTTTFDFRVRHDDGIRVWIDYVPGCSNGFGVPMVSGSPNPGGAVNDRGFTDGCLVINDWRSGDRNPGRTQRRTLPPGTYTIQVDHFEGTGGARLGLEIIAVGFDDPNYGGTYLPNNGDWRMKIHDLFDYAGLRSVALRFRLDRLGSTDTNDGWWVVDVLVVDP